jgi:DNA polymerase/3'-5' exonuclease PolX
MSTGEKIPLERATEIALRLWEDLKPVATRCKVAGSVRRQRPEVGDIELVVEAKMVEGGLFPEPQPDIASIVEVAARWGQLITKNPLRALKVQLAEGPVVELWIVSPPASWGSLLAIRTGPADLGKLAVSRLQSYGLRHVDGHVVDGKGEVVPTPTEAHFFTLAGLPTLEPAERQYEAARIPLSNAQRDARLRSLEGRPKCTTCRNELTDQELLHGGAQEPCARCKIAEIRGGRAA